ncbi:homoserine kinase [Buchnera aphidicola]|uniref:Homoserine kinase n=1 Tax=Buchnera aphidicola subsp. Tuberolachnus salignus TaxID=98804 RepID=A0A160SXB8_BUCTT|nr:homoserine kinase [Buchnera aphidicola]CUR53115.1 Homoserine kinase [Buchnera aphidicola (Tuberolachnus salignus)]
MIKIYAPASIGNLGVGFDLLGAAISPIDHNFLGDCITVCSSKIFNIINTGEFSTQLPNNMHKNIVYQTWKIFCKIIQKKIPVKIILEKNMPIGSGLGSSASSIVASTVALNIFFKTNLKKQKLLKIMGKLEGLVSGSIHYDNVAPSFLGGTQLIIQEKNIISQKIPMFENWFWVIAWPGSQLSTVISRDILPKKYTRKTCVQQNKNIATFMHAIYTNQKELALQVMNDLIAEPYRIPLLKNFDVTKKNLLKLGARTCHISGSGPTIFSICDDYEVAKTSETWLKKNFLQNKKGFVHICKIDNYGSKQVR